VIFLALVLLAAPADAGAEPVLQMMKRQAAAYGPQVKAPWVRELLGALAALPHRPTEVFYRTADRTRAFTEAEAAKLPAAERAALERKEMGDDEYYGRITEPTGYARPFDIIAAQGFSPKGKKVVDFGYGNIGQLEALASLGATVTGIEADPVLPLAYAKANRPQLRTLHGFFPSDPQLVKTVGGGYDLFISKNTLKRGYIHPLRALTAEQEKRQIKLNVTDEGFVSTVAGLLNPGGWFFIYNITPAESPADKPFVPWTDGHSPFSRETYEKAGFDVVAFDVDDTPAVRAMAKAYGWDLPSGGEPGTDLEHDLFARYTLLRKKAAR
jgi:hypothetical protein